MTTNHDADNKEGGSPELACVAQCFNRVDLCMDHTILTTAPAQTAGHTILPNGQELPPLANQRHMILGCVFLGIPIDVSFNSIGKEAKKPGRQIGFCRKRHRDRATTGLSS